MDLGSRFWEPYCLLQRRNSMEPHRISFQIAGLSASVPEGIPLEWQGRELSTGPLFFELAEGSPGDPGSQGVLDYSRMEAKAEFHVRLSFPELAVLIEDLEADPALLEPVHAVLRS